MVPDTDINYSVIRKYWDQAAAQSASAASYMAHEQGLPDDCVRYRFGREAAIVDAWLAPLRPSGSILDVGCGSGAWAARFAQRFRRVVAIEQSKSMCNAAALNLVGLPNVELQNVDAQSFETSEQFVGIFFGGLLMYLNRGDAITLLRRLKALLAPGGRVILRESTVRKGIETRTGDYQGVYRSTLEYASLIQESGLNLIDTRLNTGYEAMEVSERLVDYLRVLPFLRSREVSSLGRRVWSTVRATEPVSLRFAPKLLGWLAIPWPHLQNHFFLLESPS
jgi:SAM-dependent methyltransferase